ncbi:type III secretion system gatekeeper subunit SctW [Escherichia coli]|nr:type III secretion system gatekeeper subunit SctW [Escherichia coli]EHL9236089.1 type III secretion system gatekeeper subunit SctW [Escherichia coli]
MENNIVSGNRISFFRKHIGRLTQQEVHHQKGTEQAEGLQPEDLSPGAEVQRFIQSTDEMSAVMAQFRHRRDYEKKADSLADSFERVLDDDVLPKARQILQIIRSQNVSAEKLLSYIREFFSDDSDLVLVLRELLKRHAADPVVEKRLSSVLQEAQAQAEPRQLKAGINCALKARLFGKTLMLRPGLLRATYRQFIRSHEPESELYADWISSYGYRRRYAILDYIEEALLADISARVASSSCSEFGYLLGRLSQIKRLRSADILFVRRLAECLSGSQPAEDEALWVLLMLALLQHPEEVDAILTETVGQKMWLLDAREQSIFLQALYMACKSLPASLFDEEQNVVLLERLRAFTDTACLHELAGSDLFTGGRGSKRC